MHIGRTLPPTATPIDIAEILSGVCGIFNGQQELERFQSELKQHFGVKHCFLVSSGKAAFTLILLTLRELSPDRDEVLIPAFTCYSVPSSVVRAGLRIRLCDLRPDSLDFDFAQLSAMLSEAPPRQDARPEGNASDSPVGICDSAGNRGGSTRKVLAVVPTHLFGIPADVARLRQFIRDPGVTIVEDAAQAMGETREEGKIGTLGDVSFFSLGRGKAFSVVEGGIILTDRDDLAEGLNRLVSGLPRYGLLPLLKVIFKAAALMMFIHPSLFWLPKSLPFLKLGETLFEPHFPILKMSSFQAGLARNWRRKLDILRDVRKKKVNRWIGVLEATRIHGSRILGGQALGLLRFPLRVSDKNKRESLLRESARMGMGIMPVYPTSINAIPELNGKIVGGAFPVAESCARELVTLPTHGYLTEDDITEVSRLISRVLV
jgi:dTDP-4-amino-4,6-dideoxygalactose transaminase